MSTPKADRHYHRWAVCEKGSLQYRLGIRIHHTLCQVNRGMCGGATEYERMCYVIRILRRARLLSDADREAPKRHAKTRR